MNWTDEEIEAEAARQKQAEAEREVFDTQVSEHFREWVWVDPVRASEVGGTYGWTHSCGEHYYQLDCPEQCYLGCEEHNNV